MSFTMILILVYFILFVFDIVAFINGMNNQKWILFVVITAIMLIGICVLGYLWITLPDQSVYSSDYDSSKQVIGTVSGAEWEYITIDDKIYEIDHSNNFTSADKDEFMGIVVSGEITFRIYSVKGDEEGRYIYRTWDWEGDFYQLMD